MTARLDLSATIEARAADAAAALKARAAALLGVPEARLLLAVSPAAARRAAGEARLRVRTDRSEEGPLAFETASEDEAPALYRAGPPDAPTAVLALDAEEAVEAFAERLDAPCLRLIDAAQEALSPGARLKARADSAERGRILAPVIALLERETAVARVRFEPGGLRLETREPDALERDLQALGIVARREGELFRAACPDAAAARALARWLGLAENPRIASVRRTTKETDIAVRVDLDGEGADIDTGVNFFDHMLDQVARHGGLGLAVSCVGDVEVDAHHTIEDVCLALGEALAQALGDKRGIRRFGFELPMDETRAGVWIDLSGRPFCKFDGDIPGERVGDFPVEMCAHAFRSFADSMKAAIHVQVSGENAHHMIESSFKAFGRALRDAARVEGEALPSTKGVL